MRISKQRLDTYTAALTRCQRECAEYVRASLYAYYQLNPNASVADFRDYAVSLICEASSAYGDQASYVACAEYDATVEELGIDLPSAELWDGPSEAALESTVRYRASDIDGTYGGFSKFAENVANRAYDEPLRAANKTIVANAERDYDKGMRYARVPTGRETCGFCLMLASRGFVYHTKQSAGEVIGLHNRYHDRCDCRVVAGYEGTEIAGYDPDQYYRAYTDARQTIQSGNRDEICKEIERRNAAWSWHGRSASTVYQGDESKVTSSVRDAVERLAAHGLDATVKADGETVRVNGRLWDTANVDSAAKVADALAGSHTLITTDGYDGSFDDLCTKVQQTLKSGQSALVVSSDEFDSATALSKLRRIDGPID